MGRWLLVLAACGACRADWDDWSLARVDDGTPVAEPLTLVVGQPTSIALSLQSHESNYYYAPKNVRFAIDHPSWLEATVVGELEHSTQVDLRATIAGPNRIRFISDSTDEPYSLPLNGVAP